MQDKNNLPAKSFVTLFGKEYSVIENGESEKVRRKVVSEIGFYRINYG